MSVHWLLALGAGLGYLIKKQGTVLLQPEKLDEIEDTMRDENEPDENIPTSHIRRLQNMPASNAGSSDLTAVNPDLPAGDVEQIKRLGVARRVQMTNGVLPTNKMGKNKSKRKLEDDRIEVSGVEWNDTNGYSYD